MANEITGREFVVALKKAAVWHTPVACGVKDGLLILSDGIKVSIPAELDNSAGQPWINQADPGPMTVTGSLDAYMRYEGFDVALALLMGIAGVPAQIASTIAYSNSYTLSSKIDGLFATMAMKKLATGVWEFPSCKVNSVKLSGDANKPVKISLGIIGDVLTRESEVNTVATMAAVTVPDSKNRILMNKDAIFRVNDQSGAALGSGDQIYPSSFELNFSRPMDSESTAGASGVDEPADNGFPVATLTLKFPRYNSANDAFFTAWEAYTSKKMDITFTGADIASGNKYTFKISLPHLKIDDPEAPVSGPGKIPFSLKFNILGAASAPVGMTGLTAPMKIDVINTRSTNPLA